MSFVAFLCILNRIKNKKGEVPTTPTLTATCAYAIKKDALKGLPLFWGSLLTRQV